MEYAQSLKASILPRERRWLRPAEDLALFTGSWVTSAALSGRPAAVRAVNSLGSRGKAEIYPSPTVHFLGFCIFLAGRSSRKQLRLIRDPRDALRQSGVAVAQTFLLECKVSLGGEFVTHLRAPINHPNHQPNQPPLRFHASGLRPNAKWNEPPPSQTPDTSPATPPSAGSRSCLPAKSLICHHQAYQAEVPRVSRAPGLPAEGHRLRPEKRRFLFLRLDAAVESGLLGATRKSTRRRLKGTCTAEEQKKQHGSRWLFSLGTERGQAEIHLLQPILIQVSNIATSVARVMHKKAGK
ncbi:uncharacterized protein LOC122462316 [Chelonia mydas]|uniref:uncharacterized protein LOC122462316 n=1 Tax=Chelonia mydas TaxID=8469 RepID=UPI001CA7C340|nr:uncharacterized protein LOC122462316 [Chelonia mydas]